MKIRSRLLLFYALMLAMVLVVGGASIWAMVQWQTAADNLAVVNAQSVRAERFRATISYQVQHGLSYLAGVAGSEKQFRKIEVQLTKHLDALKAHAVAPEERDHIEGLGETKFELDWIAQNMFERIQDPAVQIDSTRARERLEEIFEEVFNDVAALNHYYRSQVDQSVVAASKAGTYATYVIEGAVVLALFQLLALVFLTQRWLVLPIGTVSEATKVISSGDFSIRVPVSPGDEWGSLAQSINDMAKSLGSLQGQLRAQERLAAMGEAAAFTAHNIQNPLAGIRAAAQVTLDEVATEQQAVNQCLRDIIQVVDRLDTWVKRFLNYAKPLELTKVMTNINELIEEAVTLSYRKFSNLGISVENDLEDNLPQVCVDPELFQQALTAILTNSFEAEGIHVQVKSELLPNEEEGDSVMVTVTDNGSGISPELLPKLFKSFVSSKKGGTGLGLAQARKIITLHNGELSFESQSGKGTSVAVKIPVNAGSRMRGKRPTF